MKKQHFTFYTFDGDARFHCVGERPNPVAVSGRSVNIIEKSDLLENTLLPKCKKCLKEEERVDRIERATR